ncbi:hypothetical protein GCM10009834_39500 [Streptomonospora arabica]
MGAGCGAGSALAEGVVDGTGDGAGAVPDSGGSDGAWGSGVCTGTGCSSAGAGRARSGFSFGGSCPRPSGDCQSLRAFSVTGPRDTVWSCFFSGAAKARACACVACPSLSATVAGSGQDAVPSRLTAASSTASSSPPAAPEVKASPATLVSSAICGRSLTSSAEAGIALSRLAATTAAVARERMR